MRLLSKPQWIKKEITIHINGKDIKGEYEVSDLFYVSVSLTEPFQGLCSEIETEISKPFPDGLRDIVLEKKIVEELILQYTAVAHINLNSDLFKNIVRNIEATIGKFERALGVNDVPEEVLISENLLNNGEITFEEHQNNTQCYEEKMNKLHIKRVSAMEGFFKDRFKGLKIPPPLYDQLFNYIKNLD